MVLASPGPLLTPLPSSSPPKPPIQSYSAQTPPRNGGENWLPSQFKQPPLASSPLDSSVRPRCRPDRRASRPPAARPRSPRWATQPCAAGRPGPVLHTRPLRSACLLWAPGVWVLVSREGERQVRGEGCVSTTRARRERCGW